MIKGLPVFTTIISALEREEEKLAVQSCGIYESCKKTNFHRLDLGTLGPSVVHSVNFEAHSSADCRLGLPLRPVVNLPLGDVMTIKN